MLEDYKSDYKYSLLIKGQSAACSIVINVGNTELSHGCEECDAEIKHKCDLNVTKININLFDILAIGSRIGLYQITDTILFCKKCMGYM